jgi:hypothetical protein
MGLAVLSVTFLGSWILVVSGHLAPAEPDEEVAGRIEPRSGTRM